MRAAISWIYRKVFPVLGILFVIFAANAVLKWQQSDRYYAEAITATAEYGDLLKQVGELPVFDEKNQTDGKVCMTWREEDHQLALQLYDRLANIEEAIRRGYHAELSVSASDPARIDEYTRAYNQLQPYLLYFEVWLPMAAQVIGQQHCFKHLPPGEPI